MNRISFYESGSLFIAALERQEPNVANDMRKLFDRMKEVEPN